MVNGWRCPVCGRGLAPWVSECPCYQTHTVGGYYIEYGNTTWIVCPKCGHSHPWGEDCPNCSKEVTR